MLEKLTSTEKGKSSEAPLGTERMPASELRHCAGLAFTHVRKAGFGLSFEHGHGFVIAKLPGQSGPQSGSWTWSAPLFINVNAGGLGVTLGYSEIDSIVILDNLDAVRSFTHTVVEVDTDVTGAAGSSAATHLPATAANLSDIKLTEREFTYSVTKGVIIDVSLTGLAYSVDADRNGTIYGTFASPAAVLEGGVRSPPVMEELYSLIDRIIKDDYSEAAAARGRVEAERLQGSFPEGKQLHQD
jgi:lipid-binding SYLF domain-containing protein